ncbi:MAG TPA: hypothetical protein VKS21_02870 [Spirochaetota bacterium]|nr:hypothetical protein [Spirochaetota bacterium]
MKTKFFIPLLVIIFSCAAHLQPPVVKIKNVYLDKVNQQNIILLVKIDVKNPNTQKLVLSSKEIAVYDHSRKLGQLLPVKDFPVEAGSRRIITAKAQLKKNRLLKSAITGLLVQKIHLNISGTVTGKIGMLKKTVKINDQFTLDLAKLLR